MKPNIVYILFDDLGYGDVSALNERSAFKTPAFDRIAHEGVSFTDAHATSAVCTPSRYSIITGRYNWRSRLKSYVLGGFSEPLIEGHTKTVAAMLKDRGYTTHLVGKWHLGLGLAKGEGFIEEADFAESHPIDYTQPITDGPTTHGFDTFFGTAGSLDMPPYAYIAGDRFTAVPTTPTKGSGMGFWRQGLTAPDFVHEQVLDTLTDRAIEIIGEEHDTPFFLLLSLTGPHTPILPAPEFVGASKTNAYGDFVLHCDAAVARVLQALEAAGIEEETLVVMTSDNGCSPAADFDALKGAGHNPSYIFRGMKSDIYEGGHRIPLLVRWPALVPPSGRCDRLVSLADLYATLSEIVGYRPGSDEAPDSVSMLPLLKDPTGSEVRSSLISQSIDGSLSLRRGRWKLEMCPGSGGWSFPRPDSAEEEGLPSVQLYDLEQDIGETTNVQHLHPAIVASMREELATLVRRGRSTDGPPLANDGVAVWKGAAWLDD
ncbi:MAG: arylsulfatase [Sphaerochaeta sp.]|jgi:arylsulfatase A|nr:arylsulfatase [Sphaerochaeta sp.]